MNRYFRLQRNAALDKYSLDLQEGSGEYKKLRGITASTSPDGLDGGARFGGAWDAYDDNNGVVYVLEGRVLESLYDGVVLDRKSVKVIAYFTKGEWSKMIDDQTAWDYE